MLNNINLIDLRDLGNFSNYCDMIVKKRQMKRRFSVCQFKFINCIFETFGRKSVRSGNISRSTNKYNNSTIINKNQNKNDFYLLYKNLIDEIIRTVTNLVNEFSYFNLNSYNHFNSQINFENFGLEIFKSKLNHFYENKNLEKFLKEEVDKFNDYYNIQKIIERQNFQIENELTYLKELEDNKFSSICLCCKKNFRNVILFPCSHFIFCNVCSKEILLCGECPICNVKIEDYKHVN